MILVVSTTPKIIETPNKIKTKNKTPNKKLTNQDFNTPSQVEA